MFSFAHRLMFFLLCIGSSSAGAQVCSFSIRGEVIDLHDNKSLNDAIVTVEETNQQVLTNLQGEFLLTGMCAQNYTLIIRHPQCKELRKQISPPFSGNKRFYLEHHINELEEIIVMELSRKNTTKTGIEGSLSAAEVRRYRAQSLGDALAQLSGVSALKTGNAIVKPMAHGVTGTRLAIVNAGIRLQDHEWGADHAPSIDVNGSHSIQWIKGANALKYGGDALGGVLEIIPEKFKQEDAYRATATSGYQSQGKGIYVLTDFSKTAQTGRYYGINTSLKNAGDLESVDYVLTNTGNREGHLSAFMGRNTITREWRLDYRFFQKESGILSAAHLGTLGDLARAIDSPTPLVIRPWDRSIGNPRQFTTHHNLNFRFNRRMSNILKWDASYSVQFNTRKEFDTRRGDLANRPALDIRLTTHDVTFNLDAKVVDNVHWKSGFITQLQDNFANPATGTRRLIPDYTRVKLGSYAIIEYLPSNDFIAEMGFRYDYDSYDVQKYYRINDWEARGYDQDFAHIIQRTTSASQYYTEQKKSFGNFSGSVGLKQHLGSNHYVLINVGLLSRSPNPSELFSDGLHHALATIEKGELRLTQERAMKYMLAFEKKRGKVQYSTTVYWSDVRDYILLAPTTDGFDQTRNSAFLKRKYVQLPRVNMGGIDFDITYDLTANSSFRTSLAWTRAYEKKGEDLIDIPPLNLSSSLRFRPIENKPFELRLSSNYTAAQTAYPNTDFEYTFIREGELSTEVVDISTPPAGYHLMGFEINTKLPLGIELGLFVDNISNKRYRNYNNRLRYFAAETGRNIRVEISYTF